MKNKTKKLTNKRFVKEVSSLWPAAKGSLALVKKPCIHPQCKVCKSGEKHAAYIFAYMKEGKRCCMYVPQRLVSVMKQAIENGRRLEELMKRTGPAIIEEYRQGARRKCVRQSHSIAKGSLPTARAVLKSNARSTRSKKKTRV
jgi:hypothetical protein